MDERMEKLREIVNHMVISEHQNADELIKSSQELDRLILLYIKKDNYLKALFGDINTDEFDDFLDKLLLLDKVYDSMRIVDPVEKKVLEIKNAQLFTSSFECFNFWQKHIVCNNCISMRAYNENDTFFKCEYHEDNLYTVAAVPVTIKDRKLVVEVLKNIPNVVRLTSKSPEAEVKILSSVEYLNQAAVRDELTNLYNRRYVKEKLPYELFNASVKEEPLSVIYMELNFFKLINDTYGHFAGDVVLKQLAQELLHDIEKGKDWVARYGSQEFLICLVDKDSYNTKIIAERVRNIIKQTEFYYETHKITLNCRIGVHTFSNDKEYPSIYEIIESLRRNAIAQVNK